MGLAMGTRGGCHNRSLAYEVDVKGTVIALRRGRPAANWPWTTKTLPAFWIVWCCASSLRNCFDHFNEDVARIYTMTTGIAFTPEELTAVGERVCNLKKAFNIREGWKREDDWLPGRVLMTRSPAGRARACMSRLRSSAI